MANIAIDSYDKLYIRNENTGSPTTFQDSSTANPKTITANGNAKQLPIKFNKSAGFFNGTTDYVIIPDHADFDISADFTMECFVNYTAIQAGYILGNGNTSGFALYFTGTVFNLYIAGSIRASKTQTPVVNTWYHIMVVRSSGTITVYVDAVGGTGASYATAITSSHDLYIGQDFTDTGYFFKGWMKELRISNVARTVAVPTAKYTSDANTILLMHFDTPAESPIGPSLNFPTHANVNNVGGMLTIADHADWDMTDLTVECFFQSNSIYDVNLINIGGVSTELSMNFGRNTQGAYSMDGFINGTRINKALGFNLVDGAWYHYALVRSGSTAYSFINGHLLGTTAVGSTALAVTTGVRIGDGSNYIRPIGNMREIRISNTARYTASFTPSQTGFISDSNTLLYIKGNEANGSTSFTDSSSNARTVTNGGSANVTSNYAEDYRSCIFKDDGNTVHKPYPVGLAKVDFFAMSTGAYYGNADTDYLSIPTSADWDFGTADFTGEAYVRASSFVGQQVYFSVIGSALFYLQYYNAGPNFQASIGSTAFTFTGAGALVANTWYHVLMSRSGTSLRLFLNGTQVDATKTSSGNVTATTGFRVGFDGSGLYNGMRGLMDNIRIAKGVARYTATFDPPFDDAASTATGNFFLFF